MTPAYPKNNPVESPQFIPEASGFYPGGLMLTYDTTRILRGEEGYALPGRRGFECGVGSRQEPHYQCSRPPEHNGRHAAHTDTGIQVASWENRPGVTR